MAETLQVATITNKHGVNFYVARTDDDLTTQVAQYCREWWATEGIKNTPPEDDEEAIIIYFEENNSGESLDMGEAELS